MEIMNIFFFLPEIDLGQRSIQVERVSRCAIPPFEEECFDFHNKILFEDC